jgi:hypothetical protein
MRTRLAAVSIDTDFFTRPDEQELVGPLARWLRDRVEDGMPVTLRDNHVDYVGLAKEPVDVTVNFDFHVDMRIEFLLGARLAAPTDATVFESVVATGLTQEYVWAHPVSRRPIAAKVYATAILAAKQPLLSRMHCLPGPEALSMLDELDVSWAFICRSPEYATQATDAAFAQLERAAG